MHSHPHTGAGQVNCRLCGRPVDANTAALRNGVCRAPACEAERNREAAHAIQQRDWDQYRSATAFRLGKSAAQIDALAQETGRDLGDLKIQMLPRQTRPMTGPDPEERAEFLTYLRQIIDQSFAEEDEPTRAPGRASHDAPESVYTTASCSTCKGDCCNLGGPHKAFLNADVISEFRALHPDWDADRIFESYTDRLPEVTALGSCQFHGEKGCTLSRDQRAQLCNSHHCRPLKYLLRLRGAIGADPVALVALDEDGDGLEASVIEDGDWRYVAVDDAAPVGDERRDEIIGTGLSWLPETSPMISPIRLPDPSERACRWCGQPIGINQSATTESCGGAACERARMTEVAKRFSNG